MTDGRYMVAAQVLPAAVWPALRHNQDVPRHVLPDGRVSTVWIFGMDHLRSDVPRRGDEEAQLRSSYSGQGFTGRCRDVQVLKIIAIIAGRAPWTVSLMTDGALASPSVLSHACCICTSS